MGTGPRLELETRRDRQPEGRRLARPLEIEHPWGHARDAGNDTLDRFEAAVAYAIREAARLQRGPESRLMVVSQTEDSTR
jgi:hypothetical protein